MMKEKQILAVAVEGFFWQALGIGHQTNFRQAICDMIEGRP
jgi:hypothetical protein